MNIFSLKFLKNALLIQSVLTCT